MKWCDTSDSCPSAGTTELDILEEGIFDGQTQKVENALVLSPGADVLANFVPIVFVELQSFEQQQRFLLRPLPGRLVLQHRTFAIVLVQFQTEIVVAVGIPLAVRSTWYQRCKESEFDLQYPRKVHEKKKIYFLLKWC